MAVPLEVLEKDKTVDDSRRGETNPPSTSPKQKASSSFLPAIQQRSEYVQLAKAGGHKGIQLQVV